MSKLACPCGEVICDNTDNLPYKGYLFADTEFLGLFEPISRDIAGFIASRLAGTERKWLADYFGSDMSMDDEELVHTIIARYLIHPPMSVYQCQKCGRARSVANAKKLGRPHRSVGPFGDAVEREIFRRCPSFATLAAVA
jgi:hypothetical protein